MSNITYRDIVLFLILFLGPGFEKCFSSRLRRR